MKRIKPTHPGIILLKEFLEPMGISQYRLAKDINVPVKRINTIVKGKSAISPDTALRLSAFFTMSEDFWINMQANYDALCAQIAFAKTIQKEVRPWAGLSFAISCMPNRVS
ncbi:MAG: HigA family addiction module antitoxin [Gammaproteobacteria bacterium]|nr:HigA family addiction module antitoxin [Gammaproteobacteria bacterium]